MSRVTFEGFRTTDRTVAMIEEARRLFGSSVGISQGGYNPGDVAASSGTHDLDAIDFKTRLMSTGDAKRFELCLWRVGFAAWRRVLIPGLWQPHTHCVPKDGDLSAGAARQVTDFHHGLNGLKGHGPYPGILASGYAYRTWEQYQAGNHPGTDQVSLAHLVDDFTHRIIDKLNVQPVQAALAAHLKIALIVDGDPGPQTRAAYQSWQTHLGYSGKDADGVPGFSSLTQLGLKVQP